MKNNAFKTGRGVLVISAVVVLSPPEIANIPVAPNAVYNAWLTARRKRS